MAVLAKPQNKLAQKPQRYQEVGGKTAPTIKALNGIGTQVSANNVILSAIANSFTRRRNVDHKIQTSLYNDLERRREALKKLNGQKVRPQLISRNLQKRKPATEVRKKLVKEKKVDDGGGLGILSGIGSFFQRIVGSVLKVFVLSAAFKWFSQPGNARRFVDAFTNFYNLVLKPIGSFVINWTTWALDGIGSAAGGIGKIINGVKNGEVGELMSGFGNLLKGLPAIGSVAFLLNPIGSLKFIWNLVSDILGIKPPREQDPQGRPKPKPKPKPKQGPGFFQRQFQKAKRVGGRVVDQGKKLGGRVVDQGKKLGGEALTGLRKIGTGFKTGLVTVGKGLNGIKDAAMRKVVEPAIEYVKPMLGKLKGLKGAIEKKLMQVLGPKGAKLLQKFGGKGGNGLMKKIGSKAIPILGGIANLYFGYEALKAGDPIGALLEFASGAFDLVGLIPGGQFGPGVSMGMDIYNFLRDMVPGIKDTENRVVKGLGLDPVMDQIKKFGAMLPGAETGRGPGFDAYDPRMRSGNYLVGALQAILEVMPGGEILKNEFGPKLFEAKRAFGSGVIALGETPMMAPVVSAKNEIKDHLAKFFGATVAPIKTLLGGLLKTWLGSLPMQVAQRTGLTNLLGLGDEESLSRSTGAPTLDPNRNYGIKENDKFFFEDDKGQKFHAANTGSGLQFFEGGINGVGGRLRHTTNEDGTAANTGMVQAFLKAKGETASPSIAGIGDDKTGKKKNKKIILHWTAGSYDDDRSIMANFGWAGYHRYVKGDGSVVPNKHPGHSSFGQSPPYHTADFNTGNASFSISAMLNATENNFGKYPVKDVQVKSLAQAVANLAKTWGWTAADITKETVPTHGELPDQGGKWDLAKLKQGDKMWSGPEKIREMVRQRMNHGGIVNFGRFTTGGVAGEVPSEHIIAARVKASEAQGKKYKPEDYERKNLGGLVKVAETRGARVMGQSSGINRESIMHPGITKAPVEIGVIQRVFMPIPTPMSASSGSAGGGSKPPSPLSTFGR